MWFSGIGARRVAALALAAGFSLIAPTASASAAATLDPAFGEGGFTTTTLAGAEAVAYDAVILPNGKIVVAGQATPENGTGQIVVARYLPEGSLDPEFGTDGVYTSALPEADGPFVARAVRRQAPGRKILVAGGYGQGSILLMRLTHRGQPDPSFGTSSSGIATLPVGGIGQALALAGGERLLVGAADGNDNGQPMIVAGFTADGRPDTAYGDNGTVESIFWDPMQAASAGAASLRTTPEGGVIGMGHLDYIGGDGHGSAGVFQLDPDGDPVTAFGEGGHVEVDFPVAGTIPAFWFPAGITVDRQGRVTAAGASTNYGGSLLAARLEPSGELDSEFGREGRAVVGEVGDGGNYPTAGVARTAAGTLTAGIGPSLVQLRANGVPRPRFGPRGTVEVETPANVAVNAVRRSGRRHVIVAGNAGNDLYVARYGFPAPQR